MKGEGRGIDQKAFFVSWENYLREKMKDTKAGRRKDAMVRMGWGGPGGEMKEGG